MGAVYLLLLHPLVLTPLFWWLDKKYGDAVYRWLPDVSWGGWSLSNSVPLVWVVEHWGALNWTWFLLFVSLLFIQMFRESRQERRQFEPTTLLHGLPPSLDLDGVLDIDPIPVLLPIPGSKLEGANCDWFLLLRNVDIRSRSQEPLRLNITFVIATPTVGVTPELRLQENGDWGPVKDRLLAPFDLPWLRCPLELRSGETRRGNLGFSLRLGRAERGILSQIAYPLQFRIHQQSGHQDAHPDFPFACSLEVIDQFSGRRLVRHVPGTKETSF